ncbi:MAG: PilZ domain-containing protein [Candidatus Omnitrophica bacterium]|nr:PilZ domain-containing protein [Candidatus Omnitrophota bacterium]
MPAWDGIDRRRFVRVKVYFKTNVSEKEKFSISSFAEELSQSGIRISIKRELDVFSLVDLEIFLREEPIVCQGKVIWVKKVEGEHIEGGVIFDVGLKLRKISVEDRLLIKTFVAQKKKEKKI